MVGVRCVMDHARLELLAEQGCPGLGVGGGDDFGAAVVVARRGDEQLGEEALVGQAPSAGAAAR